VMLILSARFLSGSHIFFFFFKKMNAGSNDASKEATSERDGAVEWLADYFGAVVSVLFRLDRII